MASEAQHTSGPWTVKKLSMGELSVLASENEIAIVGPVADSTDKANARLIAAAPDMLAALRLASGVEFSHPVLEVIDAAIRKATAA